MQIYSCFFNLVIIGFLKTLKHYCNTNYKNTQSVFATTPFSIYAIRKIFSSVFRHDYPSKIFHDLQVK